MTAVRIRQSAIDGFELTIFIVLFQSVNDPILRMLYPFPVHDCVSGMLCFRNPRGNHVRWAHSFWLCKGWSHWGLTCHSKQNPLQFAGLENPIFAGRRLSGVQWITQWTQIVIFHIRWYPIVYFSMAFLCNRAQQMKACELGRDATIFNNTLQLRITWFWITGIMCRATDNHWLGVTWSQGDRIVQNEWCLRLHVYL